VDRFCESKTHSTPVEVKEKEEEPVQQIIHISNLPSKEDQPNCKACDEQFEQFYDEKSEDWMSKDVVDIGGIYYHEKCSKDILNTNGHNHISLNIPLRRTSSEFSDNENPKKKLIDNINT